MTKIRPLNVLIVYHNTTHPMRVTIHDHLYSFRNFSRHHCFYLNMASREPRSWVKQMMFDVIIFHTTFLSLRWSPSLFKTIVGKASLLKHVDAVKVGLPQDEFVYTDLLCDFINEFGLTHVFSVAPQSEWVKIYQSVDFNRVRFTEVMTGYLDDSTVLRIEALRQNESSRTIDIGYRAWRAEPWLGSHGTLKVKIADTFAHEAPKYRLSVDISTRNEDTLFGDNWYRFLLNCKYAIGVEGGASVLDRDGQIKSRTEEYVRHHESATFDEIASACFPGLDGSVRFIMLSPRHLEACATRTCQVLIEGDYSGVLKAGDHYIPLKRDFSNLDQVLRKLQEDRLRTEITDRAYQDIVASGRYTYRTLVNLVFSESARHVGIRRLAAGVLLWNWAIWILAAGSDCLKWKRTRIDRSAKRKLYRILLKLTGISGGSYQPPARELVASILLARLRPLLRWLGR